MVFPYLAYAESNVVSHGHEFQKFSDYQKYDHYGQSGHLGRGAYYRYRAFEGPLKGWQDRVSIIKKPKIWSAEWYGYCGARFATFDPRTGHYQDERGKMILCR